MVQTYKQIPLTPKEAACCASPMDTLLDAELFKALGDATRLSLLSCLAKCGRPCSVTEIAECCSVDFSVVSRHLKILEDAEIIKSKKEGRTVWYEVRLERFVDAFRGLADAMEDCCPNSPVKRKNKKSCC